MTSPSGTMQQSSLVHSNVQNYASCQGACTIVDPNDWFNIGDDVVVHDPHFSDPPTNDDRHRSGAMASAGASLLVPDDVNDLDDNGITSEALPLDLTLGPRFLGAAVDMGAYEWCLGDFNLDGFRDGADLGILLNNWGNPGLGDLNGDGTVDGADLGLMLNVWNEPCPTESEVAEMLLSGTTTEAVDELLTTYGFDELWELLDWMEELEAWERALVLADLLD